MSFQDEIDEAMQFHIERGEQAYRRGGQILFDIFHHREHRTHLTGEETLLLYNTYGIPPYFLVLICKSHGYTFDADGFIKLLAKQEDRTKNRKTCPYIEKEY